MRWRRVGTADGPGVFEVYEAARRRLTHADAYRQYVCMHTVRMTMNIDEALLAEVTEAHPGVTKTALVERGLRALLAQEAAERLARMGGTAKRAQRSKRSAWRK